MDHLFLKRAFCVFELSRISLKAIWDAGSELNSDFVFFVLFLNLFFFGSGGPGAGFGGPGGGVSDNRSSGKPLLLLRLKNHPPGAPKPPPGPRKPNKTKKHKITVQLGSRYTVLCLKPI